MPTMSCKHACKRCVLRPPNLSLMSLWKGARCGWRRRTSSAVVSSSGSSNIAGMTSCILSWRSCLLTPRLSASNYVMQHVLEHAGQVHRRRFWNLLIESAQSLSTENFACAVIDKALTYGAVEDCVTLARTFLSDEGLVKMARSRFGSLAVKTILELFSSESEFHELELAHAQLHAAESRVGGTRYGRSVLAAVGVASSS